MLRRLLPALVLALALLAVPAVAQETVTVKPPEVFAAKIDRINARAKGPVLLPSRMTVEATRLYTSGGATRGGWDLELAAAPDCGGANACFVAMFQGQRGGKLPGRPNARLANGDPAFFHPVTCGGSCAPNSFWFTHNGYLYSWQAKDLRAPEKAIMTQMANQAIAAGPR